MAKFYLESSDNIAEIAKQVAANPNTKVVSSDGTPISAQTLAALTSSAPAAPSQSDIQAAVAEWEFNSNKARAETAAWEKRLKEKADAVAAEAAAAAQAQAAAAQKVKDDAVAEWEFNSNKARAETAAWEKRLKEKADAVAAQAQAADLVKNTITTSAGTVKPSADTLAKLDTGSVVDNTKINTQGGLTTSPSAALTTGDVNKIATTGGAALTTGDVNKLSTSPSAALTTGDVNKLSTSPAATSSPNTMNTGSIPALTTADLAAGGKTLPQGITADQLTAALKTQQDTLNKSYSDALAGNQTALTSQNETFLKNWNTSADALKTNILSGVDTKNQQFGTQATQGFMDAFKNFQIPTNQQTGVNLGNYNDNRNAAADQWWSQYVTGRR